MKKGLQLIIFFVLANTGCIIAQTLNIHDREECAKAVNHSFRNKEWVEGKKMLDEGLKKYPNDSDLRMLSGKYYYETGEFDKARYELQESLKHNKHNVDAKQILVNVEMTTQRYSSAICYVNELLEVNPYGKGLWLKKIDIYRLQNNVEEANRLLRRLSQIYPDDIEIKQAYMFYIEEEAINKRKSGEITEAIDLTKTLIDKNPGNENYYFELVNNYLKNGDYENALIYVERGLYRLPNSLLLINKKADILGEQKRYSEVLDFLQLKMKNRENANALKKRYDSFLTEAARHHHMSDPYILYWKVFENNPGNNEAFNYIINTAIEKELYEDAFRAVDKAKKVRGETKIILLKKRSIFSAMQEQAKADEITCKLYQLYGDTDSDIKCEYVQYRYKQAKLCMNDSNYADAREHFRFVTGNGDEELKKPAALSVYNCYYQEGDLNNAFIVIDSLTTLYPAECDWYAKKAEIRSKQKKFSDALYQYEQMFPHVPEANKQKALNGYDELAVGCVKSLMEQYRLKDASEMIDHWLQIHPKSEMANYYGINISAQLKDYDKMNSYAEAGKRHNPDDIHYLIKYAESYNMQNKPVESISILAFHVMNNPHHKELVRAYSQACEDYAYMLIKESIYDESLNIINNALQYDPDNKQLKYVKGLTYEKLHMYDSAHYYQSFYEPVMLEIYEARKHLQYLKSKTYKNEFTINALAYRHADVDVVSSQFGIEYSRFNLHNTYTGRINYSGRQDGQGIQGQFEWNHIWTPTLYTRMDVAAANKYFPAFMVNASVYKTFKYEWEIELGGGYRLMNDDDKNNLFNIVAGASKTFTPCMLGVRFNSVILNSEWLYSLSAQARFFLNNPRSYIMAMSSFGSAPDVDIINNQLYEGFDITNVMCGLGACHMLSDKASIGLLGTWYNYENTSYNFEEDNGKNRNLYNLHLQLHVWF